MSERAEELANRLFPDRWDIPPGNDFANIERRRRYIQGYEEAEKYVWERIKKYLESTVDKWYVTMSEWILMHFDEYKKEIMEGE